MFGAESSVVEVPVSWYLDDLPVLENLPRNPGMADTEGVLRRWIDLFDFAYERVPGGVFTLTVHPQTIARGHHLLMFERFLEHVASHDGAWFATISDIVAAGATPTPHPASRSSGSAMLVVLGDTDAAGVIYHAAAFHWHERRFTEWLADVGLPLEQILDVGRGLPVRRADAEYSGAARLGDRLAVQARFVDVAETQFVFQTAWTQRDSGAPVLTVRTTHVACDRSGPEGRFARTTLWPELQAAIDHHAGQD